MYIQAVSYYILFALIENLVGACPCIGEAFQGHRGALHGEQVWLAPSPAPRPSPLNLDKLLTYLNFCIFSSEETHPPTGLWGANERDHLKFSNFYLKPTKDSIIIFYISRIHTFKFLILILVELLLLWYNRTPGFGIGKA